MGAFALATRRRVQVAKVIKVAKQIRLDQRARARARDAKEPADSCVDGSVSEKEWPSSESRRARTASALAVTSVAAAAAASTASSIRRLFSLRDCFRDVAVSLALSTAVATGRPTRHDSTHNDRAQSGVVAPSGELPERARLDLAHLGLRLAAPPSRRSR
jgi:hypothetical protein